MSAGRTVRRFVGRDTGADTTDLATAQRDTSRRDHQMRHLHRTTTRAIGALAVAALLATGCSEGEGEAETASSTSVPVALEDEPPTDEGGTDSEVTDAEADGTTDPDVDAPVIDDEREPATSDQASPPPAGQTGEPLTSVQGSEPFPQLDLLDLRRDGDTLTLEFAVHVNQSDSRRIGIQEVFTATDDTSTVLAQTDPDVNQFLNPRRQSVSGVTLIDRDNSNRHLVLRDATGACLCTRFGREAVDTGVYRHSAQFPAPPEGVTTVTVEVPQFPSIDGVTIREVG